jgi:hypothetical protein
MVSRKTPKERPPPRKTLEESTLHSPRAAARGSKKNKKGPRSKIKGLFLKARIQ